jgi:hypothetical protein
MEDYTEVIHQAMGKSKGSEKREECAIKSELMTLQYPHWVGMLNDELLNECGRWAPSSSVTPSQLNIIHHYTMTTLTYA